MAKIKVLRVVAKSGSFRRAGYQFTSDPTDIPLDGIKKEVRDAIQAESALLSLETEVDDVISTESDDTENGNKKSTSSGKK
ncbi:hypothetical protein [Undibacterium sp. WLX3042]|uniref:hypothetical protein n=1 Tax=Undibacterium sp. WLX3042 TaxID=3412686 RepID=UPI003C308BBD